MTISNWFELISILLAVVSIFIPFIINWIDRKSKLQQSIYLIELLKRKNQLLTIKEEENSSQVLNIKLDFLLSNLDKEINKNLMRYSITYFIVFVFIEAVLFLSALFFQISDWITKALNGKSYETGMYFLEGIFKYQESRLVLMVIFISISIYITITLSKKIFELIKSNILVNLMLFIIFNVIFITTTTLGVIILILLDPIISIW